MRKPSDLDKFSQAVLARAKAAHPDLREGLSPDEARRQLESVRYRRGPDQTVSEDVSWDVAGAASVPGRRYTVGSMPDTPRLVFFHGGGFVLGSLETHDPLCRMLCSLSGWQVMSVGYRLAPEHPFPAAVEEALAVIRIVVADHGPLYVGGDSAGGAIAAVAARRLGGTADGGPILGQVLLYPVVDLTREWSDVPHSLLTVAHMRWYRSHYAPATDWTHPDASPLYAEDLRSCPPAVVLVAEYDPLAEEAREYSARLRAAGVRVETIEANRLSHGTLGMGHILPDVAAAERLLGGALHRLRGFAQFHSPSDLSR